MAILDSVTPTYYKVLTLNVERQGGEVVARYIVRIYSVNGTVMTHINANSTLTQEEKDMVIAMFQRDKTQFEAATGLQEWVPPEEP